MSDYFRLFFVGSVLFVLLGFFKHSMVESSLQDKQAERHEQVVLQPGHLPVLANVPSSMPSAIKVSYGTCESNSSKWKENRVAKTMLDHHSKSESRFHERKPEMLVKSGIISFLPKRSDDPDLFLMIPMV